jgi:hypothetical protein
VGSFLIPAITDSLIVHYNEQNIFDYQVKVCLLNHKNIVLSKNLLDKAISNDRIAHPKRSFR